MSAEEDFLAAIDDLKEAGADLRALVDDMQERTARLKKLRAEEEPND